LGAVFAGRILVVRAARRHADPLSCLGVATSNDVPVLDYALPKRRSWLAVLGKRLTILMAVAALLFVAAFALPHPTGIWYVSSDYPKWLIAIEHNGLTVGRENDTTSWGWVPVIVAKLVAYGVPVWLIWRFGFRSRDRRAAAG
jgi:hypothetical protein